MEIENRTTYSISPEEYVNSLPKTVKLYIIFKVEIFLSHNNLNISDLAKLTSVEYDTLLKLLNPNKNGKPSIESIAPIVNIIEPEDYRMAILGNYYRYLPYNSKKSGTANDKLVFIANTEELSEPNTVLLTNEEFDTILDDFVNYWIYSMSDRISGLSHNVIQKKFGDYGVEKITYLLKKGIIYKSENFESDVYKSKITRHKTSDLKSVLNRIEHSIKLFRSASPEPGNRYLSNFTAEMDASGLQKIFDSLQNLAKTIREEVQRNKTGPTQQIYISSILGTFLKEEL